MNAGSQSMVLIAPGPQRTKKCRKCGEEKPVEEFGGQAHTADRLHPFCRPCFGDHISAARRRQLAVSSPALDSITKEEWHEMFMVLVCGGNRRIDHAKRSHGENSHQYRVQL